MADPRLVMIRDIIEWPVPVEQKLHHIRQILGNGQIGAPAAPTRRARRGPAKARRRGVGFTRRSNLWNELKRIAPEKTRTVRYTGVTVEELERMLADAKSR